jgi:hypothetical protein
MRAGCGASFRQNEIIMRRQQFVSPLVGTTIADGGGKPGQDIHAGV